MCKLFCYIMLQNELNSNTAHFTTHNQLNLPCNKSGCCGLQKGVAGSRPPFCNKICTCYTFYQSKANLNCSK